MNEINHTDLLRALGARATRLAGLLRVAGRRNAKLNKQFEDLQAEGKLHVPHQLYDPETGILCKVDGLGNVVFGGLDESRTVGQADAADGERKTIPGHRADMCPVDNEQRWEAAKARWKNCKNKECGDWFQDDYRMCLDRQWAGKCPTLAGRDL